MTAGAQLAALIERLRRELYQLEDENAITVRDRGEVAARLARAITEGDA